MQAISNGDDKHTSTVCLVHIGVCNTCNADPRAASCIVAEAE